MVRRLNHNQRFHTIVMISGCVVLIAVFQIYAVNGIECGIVGVIHDLIHRGDEAIKGAWPFAVVISKISDNQTICGGTLISKKHVLTGKSDVS